MKKKLFGGLVALALALAPAAAAHADYPPSIGELHGVLDKSIVDPGETVTYTAQPSTYDPNEAVTQTLTGANGHTATTVSTRAALPAPTTNTFSKPAEADGSHSFVFVMPTLAAGEYTFQVLRADGSLWDTFPLTIANPTLTEVDLEEPGAGGSGGAGGSDIAGGSGGNGGGLAMTGSDIAIAGIAGTAVLLVGAGVVLMFVRRRRRVEETASA